ncbi:hypothetical protein [Jannaschia formosa]
MPIETVTEGPGGAFPGHHGRHVLCPEVIPAELEGGSHDQLRESWCS